MSVCLKRHHVSSLSAVVHALELAKLNPGDRFTVYRCTQCETDARGPFGIVWHVAHWRAGNGQPKRDAIFIDHAGVAHVPVDLIATRKPREDTPE